MTIPYSPSLTSPLVRLFSFPSKGDNTLHSVKNGLILLTIAFLVSPMGIPMIAAHLLAGVQHISSAIKNL